MQTKQHVSFSELRTWMECPFQHKLTYIDKVENEELNSHYLEYGLVLHQTIETWLKGGPLDLDACEARLRLVWDEKKFDSKEYKEKLESNAKLARWKYEHSDIETHVSWARNALSDLSDWLNEQFGDWTVLSIEDVLYEPTVYTVEENIFNFKGFIDAIIVSRKPNKQGKIKEKVWILDWKTASAAGWNREKIEDIKTWGQVALYKKYWSIREKKNLKDVGCAFILLKKTAKKGKSLKRIDISIGEKTIEKVDKKLASFVAAINAKRALKNRTACRYCQYKDTIHCDQVGF
jgi:hypothetical protein